MACGATYVAPSVSPSAPPRTFTMSTDREMITFAADRGALIAFSTKDAPPPYDSKIQRADPSTAYSVDFTVVDLSTGKGSAIDRFALSAATYHGGGGGPRRPAGSIVIGPDRAAWTRLVEGAGGSVTGELRIASLAEPGRATVVGSSTEWIRPLGVDAHRLLYVLGGKTEDQLHVRDLDTGADRIVTTGAVGDQQREGGIPGFNAAVLAGDWAVWLDTPRAAAGKIRAVNVASGAERSIDAGGSSCSGVSAGTRYVAWYCAANINGILDVTTLEPTRDVPFGVAPEASDDALIWFTVIPNGRTVTLFRPR